MNCFGASISNVRREQGWAEGAVHSIQHGRSTGCRVCRGRLGMLCRSLFLGVPRPRARRCSSLFNAGYVPRSASVTDSISRREAPVWQHDGWRVWQIEKPLNVSADGVCSWLDTATRSQASWDRRASVEVACASSLAGRHLHHPCKPRRFTDVAGLAKDRRSAGSPVMPVCKQGIRHLPAGTDGFGRCLVYPSLYTGVEREVLRCRTFCRVAGSIDFLLLCRLVSQRLVDGLDGPVGSVSSQLHCPTSCGRPPLNAVFVQVFRQRGASPSIEYLTGGNALFARGD